MRLVDVPWARKGSAFTLLFEQAALALVREMPVLFVTPGRGKDTLRQFADFLAAHRGEPG